jgi:hypothetical protein
LVDIDSLSPETIAALPGDQRPRVATAFADAITSGFRFAVPLIIGGFGATLLLRSAPLRLDSASARRTAEADRDAPAGVDGRGLGPTVGRPTSGHTVYLKELYD